jgi:hypothetical protein
MRDKLNSRENYLEIIERQKVYIQEELEDLAGYSADDTDAINATYITLSKYSLDNLLGTYSAGESLVIIRQEYIKTLHYFHHSWDSSSSYVQMVWMLSMGILLNVEQADFSKLAECVQHDNPNDFVIDFLISSRIKDWPLHDGVKFPRPYRALTEVVNISGNDKTKASERLLKYLQKEWYRGHSDTGWHDAHKSKWNIHTGYWSFESGALAKILDLDDSILKDQQYYPYDMVHWKD